MSLLSSSGKLKRVTDISITQNPSQLGRLICNDSKLYMKLKNEARTLPTVNRHEQILETKGASFIDDVLHYTDVQHSTIWSKHFHGLYTQDEKICATHSRNS